MHRLPCKSLTVFLLATFLLCLAAGGCRKRQWETRIEGAMIAVDKYLGGLPLAGVQAAGLEPVRPSTLVVVGTGTIGVFNASLVKQWWDEVLARELGALDDVYLSSLFLKKTQAVALSEGKLNSSDLRGGPEGYFITPLFDVLLEAAHIEKVFAQQHDDYPFKGIITLYIEENASFEVIARVLYTAGQAEYAGYRFVVETPEGNRVICVEAPRFGVAIKTDPDDPDADKTADCAEPQAVIRPKGIMLYAMRGSPGGGMHARLMEMTMDEKQALAAVLAGETLATGDEKEEPAPGDPEGDIPEATREDDLEQRLQDTGALKILGTGAEGKKGSLLSGGLGKGKGGLLSANPDFEELSLDDSNVFDGPEPPDWGGRVMLGPEKACPSVPRKNGKLDHKGLADLIAEVKKMAPGCSRALVSASPPIPWHEIADVMATVKVTAGFENLVMSVPGEEEEFDAEACAEGLRPAEVER
ncbi:MAG: hypothetical protein ABIJ56_07490 [Pseudomonadota bacterium]